ncbi:MAG: TlpA family protein disulfide reductase [Acidobacteria bacterium]|nr:TlpA family protein disulfide reductase [Acidobacteriota bacterium]MCW5950268.1 TlpA family protein disulfide reductase [Pyrinomonadaceae bacterium]
MKFYVVVYLLFLSLAAAGQSGRVAGDGSSPDGKMSDKSVRELFEEAAAYVRTKASEMDAKKVQFSQEILDQIRRDQRMLAARYASIAELRLNRIPEDVYYTAMLYWMAGDQERTAAQFAVFLPADGGEPEAKQTARAISAASLAQLGRTAEAEALLADYSKNEPRKLAETSRIRNELAKAYLAKGDFARMAPHAAANYDAAKTLLADAASRPRALDELIDSASLLFEAYKGAGSAKLAEDALDEFRTTAAAINSLTMYFYAADQKIRYLIDIGRKPDAMKFYASIQTLIDQEVRTKPGQEDLRSRFIRRAPHYQLLGESAPEFTAAEVWFPGVRRTFADLKGKVVLVDFWATWCAPCIEAFPAINEMYSDLGPEGFEVIGITRYYGAEYGGVKDDVAELAGLKRFREQYKLQYDIVVSRGQADQLRYGATSLPTTVIIDRKGIVRSVEVGYSPGRLQQMRQEIVKLLAEK